MVVSTLDHYFGDFKPAAVSFCEYKVWYIIRHDYSTLLVCSSTLLPHTIEMVSNQGDMTSSVCSPKMIDIKTTAGV
jgi:hypothetical protein